MSKEEKARCVELFENSIKPAFEMWLAEFASVDSREDIEEFETLLEKALQEE